jgi:Zn-dependent protease with chaperone function
MTQRRTFALILGLGIGGIAASAFALATAVAAVHRGSAGSGEVVIAGVRLSYPTLNTTGAILLALASVGAVAVAVAARETWRHVRQHRQFRVHVEQARPLDQDARVKVIGDPWPQAFCAGYVRPIVFVSQRTVDLLTDAELEAVLAHEHHHRRVRDPLRIASAKVLSAALFFVPALRSLRADYAEMAEVHADKAAVEASGGDPAPLASALLVFDESGPAHATGISPQRVDSLMGETISGRLRPWALAGSLSAMSGISLLTWQTSSTAAAHATLGLPFLSSQPCAVVMLVLPCLGCARALGRIARRRLHAA